MTTYTSAAGHAVRPLPRAAAILGICALVILTGCSGKKDKAASQTAAKVNKQEITVHQIRLC
jgi:ABC-type glycerol-3-phosphate transport system substrate-binding protein